LQPLDPAAGPGLEILAVDRGPGMRDVEAVLRAPPYQQIEARLASHAGQRGGLGCGLASVRRLASAFDVHSAFGQGTVVLARFFFGSPTRIDAGPRVLRCGGVSVPMAREDENGDAWAFVQTGSRGCVLVVDGLGHGKGAAGAAEAAVGEFHRSHGGDIETYFQDAHRAMRSTRGGSVFMCRVESEKGALFFAGVGNVEGRVYGPRGISALTPMNGTLGMNLGAPKVVVRELPWGPGATLVLYSDGIRSSFDLDGDSGLWRRDPAMIAAVIHRDFARGRDDATVVVVQEPTSDDVTRATASP
jgi:hypothetical protein